ncbi:MAG: hypothetical protein D6702_04935 [Planctomycetota bacterium]|nr:MAG: hypothetical protein D6702_04935 [Planctomycetota bacterium]
MVPVALVLHFLALAQEPAPPPADPVAALTAEYEASDLDPRLRYEKFQPRFLALVESAAEPELRLRARLWLFREMWWEQQRGGMYEKSAELFETILREHGDSPLLAALPESGFVLRSDQRIPAFRRLLERSPHPEVKAAALFGIGREAFRSRDPEVRKEMKPALERLARDYGDLRFHFTTYGELAAAFLAPHPREALAVGRVAPEIVGRTVDGEELRLSDFRGRVVVLDFWGDW